MSTKGVSMEISKIHSETTLFHSHLSSEKFVQSSCNRKDGISSCKQCQGQICCSSIGNFFRKIWTEMINFLRCLFCCKCSSSSKDKEKDLKKLNEESNEVENELTQINRALNRIQSEERQIDSQLQKLQK